MLDLVANSLVCTDNSYRLGLVSKISISNSLATSSWNLNMVVLHAACTQFRVFVDDTCKYHVALTAGSDLTTLY